MKPVEEFELSGLLDNELDERRAAEVRASIEADPKLREKLEALRRVDGELCRVVEDVSFMPDIGLPSQAAYIYTDWHWAAAAGVVVSLLIIRFLPKLFDLAEIGVALHLAATAVIAFLFIRMAHHENSVGALVLARST